MARGVAELIQRDLPAGALVVSDSALTVMGFGGSGLKIHLEPDHMLALSIGLGNAALAQGADEARAIQIHQAIRLLEEFGRGDWRRRREGVQ